jgi:uncharacterized protein YbgA (DUF1722 family)
MFAREKLCELVEQYRVGQNKLMDVLWGLFKKYKKKLIIFFDTLR